MGKTRPATGHGQPRTVVSTRSVLRERALGARHATLTRVGFDRHADSAGGGLEDRLGDVMAVTAVVQDGVEVGAESGREANTMAVRPPKSTATVASDSSIGMIAWP
jgi:hypothetical protein